ncbi:MAG: isoprenyl transferase [Coriobacteriia bacterium]|nr:isoprenyl transferase [Coriobacteriia bacterium]
MLLSEYNDKRAPLHVAIIMDGNGRWAKAQGKPRLFGHKAGANAVREAIAAAIELKVKHLTIFSFSSENWSRPKDEVFGLMALFIEVLTRELANLNEMNVWVSVIGDMVGLPEKTRSAFENCVTSTQNNDGLNLIVALNYGSRADITDAVVGIAKNVADGTLGIEDVTQDYISSALSTRTIPDPDLLIRTSGERRISNFLLWELAYTELYFTDELWPDFNRDSLLRALVDFQNRNRRFGGA